MIYSRYNILIHSEKYGYLLLNTRTMFFSSLDEKIANELLAMANKAHGESSDLNVSEDILETLQTAKVLVADTNEDEDYFNVKKFVRYKKAFSQNGLGIVLVPTFACNFRCPYCYEDSLPHTTIEDKVLNDVVGFIQKSGQKDLSLCWHGGEPLLAFPKIRKFIELVNLGDIQLVSHSMVSNGYLLDQEKCSFFNQANLSTIQITLDGDRGLHDKTRILASGKGTFDKIVDNIELLFKYAPKCRVVIRVNVHADNIEAYPKLKEILCQRWGDANYVINIAFVNDVNQTCKVACMSNKNKVHYLHTLYEKYGIASLNFLPQPQAVGCTATSVNTFVIGPSGELYKCWVDVGRKEKVIGSIYDDRYYNNLLPAYTVGSDMFSDSRCKQCPLFPLCDGGCILRRYNQTHHGVSYDPCPVKEEDYGELLELLFETKKDKI